jgi:hypothetical protein
VQPTLPPSIPMHLKMGWGVGWAPRFNMGSPPPPPPPRSPGSGRPIVDTMQPIG